MSLAPCRECGLTISNDATACPKCGARRPKSRVWLVYVGAVAGIFGLILYSGHRIGEQKTAQNKQECAAALLVALRQSGYKPGEAEAIARTDPHARKVCAEFEMDGVPVIP